MNRKKRTKLVLKREGIVDGYALGYRGAANDWNQHGQVGSGD